MQANVHTHNMDPDEIVPAPPLALSSQFYVQGPFVYETLCFDPAQLQMLDPSLYPAHLLHPQQHDLPPGTIMTSQRPPGGKAFPTRRLFGDSESVSETPILVAKLSNMYKRASSKSRHRPRLNPSNDQDVSSHKEHIVYPIHHDTPPPSPSPKSGGGFLNKFIIPPSPSNKSFRSRSQTVSSTCSLPSTASIDGGFAHSVTPPGPLTPPLPVNGADGEPIWIRHDDHGDLSRTSLQCERSNPTRFVNLDLDEDELEDKQWWEREKKELRRLKPHRI